MKDIILTLLTGVFCVLSLRAQEAPKPPLTPKSTSEVKSYSIRISDDSDGEDENTSVTITQSDDVYKFRASFSDKKNDELKTVLIERLGNTYLINKGDKYEWKKRTDDGDESFECKLTDGKLKIFVDKNAEEDLFFVKVMEIGEELNQIISGDHGERDMEQIQRDLSRAKEDIKRAEQEIQHAQREVERAQQELLKRKMELKKRLKEKK